VVKSQKDKAWDSMRDSIKKMRSAMKINDWSAILDEFKNTNKIIEKSKMLILKNGLPKFYVKMLMDLEDFLVETLKDKEAIKKMKKEISKAFNTMKLSLRKHNKDYENEIAACRANPTEYVEVSSSESDDSSDEDEDSDSDEDEDSDSDSSEEPVKKPAAKPAAVTKPAAKPAAKPKVQHPPPSSRPYLISLLLLETCSLIRRGF
jgi:translation initiation factor 3 subunit C